LGGVLVQQNRCTERSSRQHQLLQQVRLFLTVMTCCGGICMGCCMCATVGCGWGARSARTLCWAKRQTTSATSTGALVTKQPILAVLPFARCAACVHQWAARGVLAQHECCAQQSPRQHQLLQQVRLLCMTFLRVALTMCYTS
jgi:hypothetical protein